jgi:DNA-binding HxlR family transcriptional regulator
VHRTAEFIGKKWTLSIILEVYKKKTVRYQTLKNSLPKITSKILSARLKELEKEGLVSKKTDYSIRPIKCEYSLTETGKEFIHVIKLLKSWALKYKIKNKICESQTCEECMF